jgi:hypothetical protein
MLAKIALLSVLAIAIPTLAGFGQQTDPSTAELLTSPGDPGCADGEYPVPRNYAGYSVQAAQDDLNLLPGNLKIAIANNGSCDSLREPEPGELAEIIVGPASPCGNPGMCITAGGLVGVVLSAPTETPIIRVILVAAVTALVVSLATVLVLRSGSSAR